jgi:hypothetical protein
MNKVNETRVKPSLIRLISSLPKNILGYIKNFIQKNPEADILGKDFHGHTENFSNYLRGSLAAKLPKFSIPKYKDELIKLKENYFEEFKNVKSFVENEVKSLYEKAPYDKKTNLSLKKSFLMVGEPLREVLNKISTKRHLDIDSVKNSENFALDEFSYTGAFPYQKYFINILVIFYLFVTIFIPTLGQLLEAYLNDHKRFLNSFPPEGFSYVYEHPLTGIDKLCHITKQQHLAVLELFSNC